MSVINTNIGHTGDPPWWNMLALPHFPAVPLPTVTRTMPVNIPFSDIGITIVTMDADGNVTIKVNEPAPEQGT